MSPNLQDTPAQLAVGQAMLAFVRRLFPLNRSLTGDGVRETLRMVAEHIPLVIHEVPTGTQAFDWTVPDEWNVRDAYIKDAEGRRVVDFRAHNLHVVGYSRPVHATMRLADLEPHLHSLPDQPDLVPYRTSYYDDTWGFSLPHRLRTSLADGLYEVCIDSTRVPGSLSYGECVLEGATADEVLIYTHTCHPSLANDNLAGIAVCVWLARHLSAMSRRYTYRIVFGPGTIGSLVWLSRNRERLAAIRHGLVAVLLGDAGDLCYKQSRRGDAPIDRAAAHVLRQRGERHRIEPFSPVGYDERQFGSPGFNLPVGRLSRSGSGGYQEYHTSGDTPDLLSPGALARSLEAARTILDVLEHDGCYRNRQPYGEPQLGRRGLYRRTGGPALPDRELALLWTLNQSDGSRSLLDIAERAGLPFHAILAAARELEGAGLLEAVASC